MIHPTLSDSEKWELLAGQVLGDLTEQERDHVEAILAEDKSQEMLWKVERTAAAAQLSLHHAEVSRLGRSAGPSAELPSDLADKIRSQARVWLQSGESLQTFETGSERLADSKRDSIVISSDESSQLSLPDSSSVGSSSSSSIEKSSSAREWMGWLCAAAAMLLAFGLWTQSVPEVGVAPRSARTAMLAGEGGLIEVDWAAGTTPFDSEVTGDVVWDPNSQSGFMRFVGMPVNDPAVEQYQLWIIDPKRDEEPIDGGVFDITASGEIIVPIDAKLNVIQPAAFAITIEKPGGVVVSTQERLPLLAAVSG